MISYGKQFENNSIKGAGERRNAGETEQIGETGETRLWVLWVFWEFIYAHPTIPTFSGNDGMARRPPGRDRQEKHDGGTDPGAHYVFLSILLKRGRSQLTEGDIVRPTALMADTHLRLKGVSIGGTMSTCAPLRLLGWGAAAV